MVLQNKLYSECCCHPGSSGSSRAGELSGLRVAMSSHALCPYVCCVLPEQSDVRAPKCTRHVQAICWSKVKAQDEVKAVQLMIQTSLPNSEGHSRSRSVSSKSLHVNCLPLAGVGKVFMWRTAKRQCCYSYPMAEHHLAASAGIVVPMTSPWAHAGAPWHV